MYIIRSGNNETYEKEHKGGSSGLVNECKLHGHTNTKRLTNYTRKKNWHYIRDILSAKRKRELIHRQGKIQNSPFSSSWRHIGLATAQT